MLLSACGGPTYKTVEVTETEPPRHQAEKKNDLPPVLPPGVAPWQMGTSPGKSEDSLPGYKPILWKTLRGLDVRTGRASSEVAALSGANVRIRGYMVPFDDEDEAVTEFLLVPVAGMCIHIPPPPMNQIIMVESAGGASRVEWDKEVEVYGQLSLAESQSPFGKTGYKLLAIRARAN